MIHNNSKKLPAQSKLDRWDEIRSRDREAIRTVGEQFDVVAFCAALQAIYDQAHRQEISLVGRTASLPVQPD